MDMPKVSPCLWFDMRGEEAAEFYTAIFPNSRIIETTRRPEGTPGPDGSVLTVTFELDGREIIALNGGPEFTFDEAISLSVDCEDQAEVDYYWERLTDGGSESVCGWLKDRFGLSWQIVPRRLRELIADPDPEVAARVTAAMLQMVKIDVAALEEAAAARV
jgi:predicted 3-demethylubiquinone-9 3-methyltransferase (glyoxalase superfamily)